MHVQGPYPRQGCAYQQKKNTFIVIWFFKNQVFCGNWPEKSQLSQRFFKQIGTEFEIIINRSDLTVGWFGSFEIGKLKVERIPLEFTYSLFDFEEKHSWRGWTCCDSFLERWVIFKCHVRLNSNIMNYVLEVEATPGCR